jgi:hypothetical protein
VDLTRVRLLESLDGGLVASLLRWRRINAICLGRHIVIAGTVDEREPGGMGLIAHELTHVRQIEERGVVGFYWAYLVAYVRGRRSGLGHNEAYHGVAFETEAYQAGALVKRDQESALVAVGSPSGDRGAIS